ncbi:MULTISPECIES: DUF6154 family protein [Bacillaceae]|jgi:hypothetical protein|uniref:Cytosolic protein n=2 Tax=Bacillaceae TaxID=186817 RepID=A0A090J3J0_9BACI|nr:MULTISPECIES: DUF6154 family protein [Bacillaceae]MCB5934875.1 DUF6154 family protein [Bacillus sp. DFI.2.34]NWN97521.1 hypothetical protein [Bacillus sp. (in: firmicutes)]AWI13230.1 hypothetical protein CQJ30_14285 [Caldibacillus thermoamylovorans]KIO60944.1 hypothetical protein B4065_3505 [Caldibacillus thermoamylovorans]KIO66106.1 hypothetical protein B4166_1119 [Caldibacillus thermoamylovorans]
MKFVDELYDFYKKKLTADDEDIEILVSSIMQELSKQDMLNILSELNQQELYQITGTYIAYKLREKLVQDQQLGSIHDKDTYIH